MGIVMLPPSAMISVSDSEMQSYLYKRLSNPLKLTDTINIRYTIDEHGSVTRVKVLNSKRKILNAEIVKAMQASPKWMPTEINGIYVKKQFTMSLDLSQIK
jgi:TonB family protein